MIDRYALCSVRFSFLLLLVGLLVGSLATAPAASAQVTTITADDFLAILGEERGIQIFGAGPIDPSDADLQAVLGATGANQTYDLRPFADRDSLAGQGLFRFLTLSEAQNEGLPGSSEPGLTDADYVVAITVSVPSGGSGVTAYEYVDIADGAGYDRYGSAIPFSSGGFSGEIITTYENDNPNRTDSKRTWALPLEANPATQWSDAVTATQDTGTPFPSTTNEEVDGVVEGYGTMLTPAGSFEVMRIRRDETVDGTTLREYDFISPSLSTSVGAIQEAGDGTYNLVYTTATENPPLVAEVNGTGTVFDIGQLGLGINLTSNPSSGTLRLARFNTSPLNISFSGSATAPDGNSITPDNLWEGWYFSISNDGLSGFTADVCIDISNLTGVSDAQRLVLLTREFASAPWTPLNSTINGNQLCTTVTSFSQFAVGSNAAENVLPVELATFEAALDGDRVQLQWATASETNNAGFAVERSVDGASDWRRLGFVEGAGTTNAPQTYRFADANLPFTADRIRYRLKQIDTDGAFEYSDAVEVALGAPERLTLHPSFPNPAEGRTTIQYGLPQAETVRLAVYDMLGRRVRLLVDAPQPAGRQEATFDTSQLASGLYLVRLVAGDQVRTGRLTVLR